MAKDVTVLKEDIIPRDIPTREMTTDCHFVYHDSGVDVVRGVSMVSIFDYYHDKGKKLTKIEIAGGQLNPKLCEPFPEKKKDK